MNGLLRRLARQAIGLEPVKVHAVARLPFVAPPPMTADAGTRLPYSETRAPGATAPTNVSARREGRSEPSDNPQETPERPDRRPAQAEGIPADVQAPPRVAGERAGPAGSRLSAAFPDKPRAPAPLLGERPQANRAHAGTDNTAMRAAAPREANPTPSAEAALLSTPGPVVTPPGAADGERHTRPADSGATRPGSHRTRPRATQSSSRSDEAPEVHLHIGRIEVTAVQEASAGRRKPTAGVQPLSLNEYLKRRQRGRP